MGKEAFELGLLVGTESDPTEEEQTTVFSFHHLLLQQFAAAKYLTGLDKVQISPFLFGTHFCFAKINTTVKNFTLETIFSWIPEKQMKCLIYRHSHEAYFRLNNSSFEK